ncbi:hypothetical protein PV439_11370 [Streptomyces scabiei]|uniref:hypothetical protein n=1 Tax=Streptomyces scabiei TaxID=1930 RepID=UPI0029B5E001|nr:hypothetical protein [Streptomyces scabiei]MDX2891942.1 hypothetical protein [Streptomyces scabiei]MDX2900149.1 hypothetical protein [Streptomyces scabiei]
MSDEKKSQDLENGSEDSFWKSIKTWVKSDTEVEGIVRELVEELGLDPDLNRTEALQKAQVERSAACASLRHTERLERRFLGFHLYLELVVYALAVVVAGGAIYGAFSGTADVAFLIRLLVAIILAAAGVLVRQAAKNSRKYLTATQRLMYEFKCPDE